jgi:hypothetical protein
MDHIYTSKFIKFDLRVHLANTRMQLPRPCNPNHGALQDSLLLLSPSNPFPIQTAPCLHVQPDDSCLRHHRFLPRDHIENGRTVQIPNLHNNDVRCGNHGAHLRNHLPNI